jgi:hypothetical protein
VDVSVIMWQSWLVMPAGEREAPPCTAMETAIPHAVQIPCHKRFDFPTGFKFI